MILVKNDFKGLVEAVFEGRRIFTNLRRSFAYLISFHIPVILLALIPPLLNWGELLLPIHIVFLEMVVHPVSAYAFENLPGRHRESGKSLVPRKTLIQSVAAGVLLSLLVLILFRWTSITSTIHQARSNSIVAVLIGNMYFVLQGAEFTINKRLFWTLLLLALATGGTPYLFELR
jgi:Ca2+-transporting ATPase